MPLTAPWAAHYTPGVPAELEPSDETLSDIIDRSVREAGPAVATDFFGRTWTYDRLGDLVARAAEGLRKLGVKAGDRVAIVLPNCPQHLVAFYAVLRLGAVVVEHNPLYTARELRHMVEDHAARVAICWDVAVEKLRHQPSDIELEHIVSVNLLKQFPWSKRLALRLPLPKARALRTKLTAAVHGTLPWEKLLGARPLAASHPRPSSGDLAVIQYTSGTTSLPKGAMLTHANLVANARQAAAWLVGMQPRQETFYGVLPMFHAFGMTLVTVLGVTTQARLVLFPSFDVHMVVDAAKRRPPTVFGAVPPIFHAVAATAKRRRVSLKAARFCICGAMNLTPETDALWTEVAGAPLIEGYGMTEASPVICGNPLGDTRRPGTVGLPFPSTQVRVVAVDDPSVDVGPGVRGELLAKGPQVFHGYWNNPVETERSLLADGWLRTGDVVIQDEDGYVAIVDRVKELIITGGFNVSPTEVEAVLRSHAGIVDASVVGVPAAIGGERVTAAVVMRTGERFDEAELRAFCKERLAAYKVPRRFVAVDQLPTSLLGKVLRAQVRDMLISIQTD